MTICRLFCQELQIITTNLRVDPEILQRELEIGGDKTKSATVNRALEDFINRRAQAKIINSLHEFDDWDPDYDYKEERRRRARKLVSTD